jgi:hypothetical protein
VGSGVLAGLKLPGSDDGILDRVSVPVLEVGDDHHVLRESARHGERLGERLDEKIANVEGRADDDVAVVELPGDEATVLAPVEEPVASALGHAVELGGQAAEVVERHRERLIIPAPRSSGTCGGPIRIRRSVQRIREVRAQLYAAAT